MKDIKKIIVPILDKLRNEIIQNHLSANQRASGETEASLKVEETTKGAAIYGRGYISTIETGRKPGKIPYGFRDIMIEWINNKGISVAPIPYKRKPSEKWQPKYTPDQRGKMALASAISYKIANEGSKLYRSGGRTDIITIPINKTIDNIEVELVSIYELEISKI